MSVLEMVLSNMPENEYQRIKEQAEQAVAQKDFDSAINIYVKELEKDPNNTDLIVDIGNLYSNLKQYSLAEEYYSRAFELNEKSFRVNHNRGLNFYRQEHYDDAIAYFDKALLIQPNSYFTLNTLGNLYSKIGKDEEAVSIFNHAIELQPDNFVAAYNLGMHYLRIGDWDYVLNAVLSYKDSIPSENLEDFYLLIGRAYYELDDYANAIPCYLKLFEIRPDWRGYQLILGESFRLSQNHSKAIPYYEKVVNAEPLNLEAYRRLVWCYYKNGNKEFLVDFLSGALNKFPESPYLNYQMAYSLYELERFDEAYKYILIALKLDESNYAYNALAGLLCEEIGDSSLSKKYFKYVIENEKEFLSQKPEEYYVYPQLMMAKIRDLMT